MKLIEQPNLKLQCEINPSGMYVKKWELVDRKYHCIEFFLDTKKDECKFWMDGKQTGYINIRENLIDEINPIC